MFEESYYAANNQKIADKKKADYQSEALEKNRATRSRDSYMKDPEKSCAQSRESYMKDPEKSCADSAARSRKSYMKDPEKRRADIATGSREMYEKDLENRRHNETGLAISYNSKKTAAIIGVRIGGLGGL